jgi:hypothetical protein
VEQFQAPHEFVLQLAGELLCDIEMGRLPANVLLLETEAVSEP